MNNQGILRNIPIKFQLNPFSVYGAIVHKNCAAFCCLGGVVQKKNYITDITYNTLGRQPENLCIVQALMIKKVRYKILLTLKFLTKNV